MKMRSFTTSKSVRIQTLSDIQHEDILITELHNLLPPAFSPGGLFLDAEELSEWYADSLKINNKILYTVPINTSKDFSKLLYENNSTKETKILDSCCFILVTSLSEIKKKQPSFNKHLIDPDQFVFIPDFSGEISLKEINKFDLNMNHFFSFYIKGIGNTKFTLKFID